MLTSLLLLYTTLIISTISGKFLTRSGHNYPFQNETIMEDRFGNILMKIVAVPVPLATTTKIIDMNKEGVHVGLVSSTIRGKANREVMEHIARILSIHFIYVSLLEGERYSRKTLMIPAAVVSLDVVKQTLHDDMTSDY